MMELVMITRWVSESSIKVWNIITSVWWLQLPFVVIITFNILRLLGRIQPSNENRKG